MDSPAASAAAWAAFRVSGSNAAPGACGASGAAAGVWMVQLTDSLMSRLMNAFKLSPCSAATACSSARWPFFTVSVIRS